MNYYYLLDFFFFFFGGGDGDRSEELDSLTILEKMMINQIVINMSQQFILHNILHVFDAKKTLICIPSHSCNISLFIIYILIIEIR